MWTACEVRVIHQMVQELDPQGQQLRVRRFDDYTREQVRTLYGRRGQDPLRLARP